MTQIAIIYHSGFGHTEVLAKDVARGVEAAGGAPVLLAIEPGQTDFDSFFAVANESDALIFGSPTYMGTVSAPMKAFMDASAAVYFTKQWKDKLAAGFTVSGSPSGDKLNTLTSLAIFAAQHGMLWIGTGQNPGNNDDTSAATDVENRLGSFIGAMAQAAVGAQVLEALDVHRGVAAQVALDLVIGVDRLADAQHLLVGQILDAAAVIDAELVGDVDRRLAADAVDVGKRNDQALVGRDVDPRNTSHLFLHAPRGPTLATPSHRYSFGSPGRLERAETRKSPALAREKAAFRTDPNLSNEPRRLG